MKFKKGDRVVCCGKATRVKYAIEDRKGCFPYEVEAFPGQWFPERALIACESAERTEYQNNIIAIMDRQHAKGLKKYGETLEDNTTLNRVQRVEHIEEELIDGLQYCEHLKKTFSDAMTVADYQRAALRTSGEYDSWYSKLRNAVYGLNGEAGECIDILKKHEFQGHDFDREHMIEELGDVAWYLPLAADALGITLEEILQRNVEKLKKRYPDGFDKARSINREE